MYEEGSTTDDLYDAEVYIVGDSSHVGLTDDEQHDHHRPLRHITPEIEPSHKCFVKQGVDRDQTGYLFATPKMYYTAGPAECRFTVSPRNVLD